MSDMTQNPPPRPRRRWLLFTSLALNIFLLGVVITGTLINWQNRALGLHGGQNPFSPRAIAEAVPEAERATARDIADAARPDQREALREVRRARMAVYRLLDEPFDRAKMEAALARMREADARLAMNGQETVLNMLEALSPEARAAIAAHLRDEARDRMRDRRGRGPRGHMDGPPDNPPEEGPEPTFGEDGPPPPTGP